MPLLSICIPTYNRAAFLPDTLDSVVSQWADDLEITVADNASTDGTQALVESYREKYGAVRYFRWDSNQGADRNYLKCVELATARHCLILGSDDALAPGAIAELRRVLEARRPTIVLFNRQTCTRDMTPIRVERFLKVDGAGNHRFDFRKPEVIEDYFQRGRSLCVAFSYLSSVVFEKQAWDAVETDEGFIGSAYIHTQKLLGACLNGAQLEYLDLPLAKCRLGFDSFRDLGLARRLLLDLDGYDHLAKRYFEPDHPGCAEALRRLVRQEYPFQRLLRYQGVAGREPDWPRALKGLLVRYRYPKAKLRLATLLGRSRRLVRLSFMLRDWMDACRTRG